MSSLDDYASAELLKRDDLGLRRTARVIDRVDVRTVRINGNVVLNFGSNDYLGLSQHADVVRAAKEALESDGAGSTGSRLTSGTSSMHAALEQEIAAWKGADSALAFGSGYLCAVGAIPALAGEGDLILSDRLNHASLIDGCRLSRATVRVFRHNDTVHLDQLLSDRSAFGRCLVVTEGIFSMDGDLAPLPEIAELCDNADAWLMVDDAHGGGVVGPQGRGTAAHCCLTIRNLVQMGTLGKALGVEGGYIAGSRALIDLLTNAARSFVFSTAPSPANAAAALAAVRIAANANDRRSRLMTSSTTLRSALRNLGYAAPDGLGPIVPVVVGDARHTVELSNRLLKEGVWAPAIRPPTVPDGTARLRISLSAAHTETDIQNAIDVFARVREANP